MMNRLSGSGPGPVAPMGGGGDPGGPAPHLGGTLGVAPQAAPMGPQDQPQGQGGNILGGGMPPGGPQGGPPMEPPSMETLVEVAHKTAYVNSALSELMSKPNLSTRDILDEVGTLVADEVMGPFDAAKYLKDLPSEHDQLRQWVAQHYSNSAQNLRQVMSMISHLGQMQGHGAASPAAGMAPQGAPQAPQMAQAPSPQPAPQPGL